MSHNKKETRHFDPTLPIEAAHAPPYSWYTDQEFYQDEIHHIFEKCWIPVGRVDQLPKPGSYFTGELVGNPYLVVKDNEGVIRAFHNVCRHKGHAVALDCGQQSTCSQFACPYHGWTYDLSGALTKAPHVGKQESFNVDRTSLKKISVAVWGQFIFIDLDSHIGGENLTRDLNKDIAPIANILDQLGTNLPFIERRIYDVQCNWKTFVDNSLDGGYHVSYIHETLADGLEFKGYETHIFDRCSIQTCGTQKTDQRLGDKVMYAWMFPNFFINRYGNMMDTNIVIPTGPNSCRIIYDFFFACDNPDDYKNKMMIRDAIKKSESIQEEDTRACESAQKGMRSISFNHGRYSSILEKAVYAFHVLLWRELEKRGI